MGFSGFLWHVALQPNLRLLLLIFTAAAIYMILRRLGCSSCYHCKSCTSGFGRLAGAFFGAGYLKKGSVGNRKGIIAFIYFLLAPFPAVFLVLSTIQAFEVLKALVLVCLLAVTVYSGSTWRQTRQSKSNPATP